MAFAIFQPITFVNAGVVFREAAVETGLRFHHFTGATGQYFLPEIMGAGAALFDYDGDGDLDVLLIRRARCLAKTRSRKTRSSASLRLEAGSSSFSQRVDSIEDVAIYECH
ncbi:MAG: VCBS repeat-containing protein [Pyrinomonadaceae bacterium]